MRKIYRATFHCFLFGLGFIAACDEGELSSRGAVLEPIACGGKQGLCPEGLECLDDAGAACEQGNECEGTCEPIDGMCGGVADIACPEGQICIDIAHDDCRPERGDIGCLGGCRPAPEPEPEPEPLPDGYCGGPADVACPAGEACFDIYDQCNPERGHAGCVGVCRPVDPQADPSPISCGGDDGAACPEGEHCVDIHDQCDPELEQGCEGVCRPVDPQADPSPISCSSNDGTGCPDDQYCADIADQCNPERGHQGCEGVCRPEESPIYCGGVGGLRCPDKLACVDDASDDCDPNAGDTDCLGTCQERPAKRRYVSHSREECAVIKFACRLGERPFFEETGCGCERA